MKGRLLIENWDKTKRMGINRHKKINKMLTRKGVTKKNTDRFCCSLNIYIKISNFRPNKLDVYTSVYLLYYILYTFEEYVE